MLWKCQMPTHRYEVHAVLEMFIPMQWIMAGRDLKNNKKNPTTTFPWQFSLYQINTNHLIPLYKKYSGTRPVAMLKFFMG